LCSSFMTQTNQRRRCITTGRQKACARMTKGCVARAPPTPSHGRAFTDCSCGEPLRVSRGMPIASSARQKSLRKLTESLQHGRLLPCARSGPEQSQQAGCDFKSWPSRQALRGPTAGCVLRLPSYMSSASTTHAREVVMGTTKDVGLDKGAVRFLA
jgi:hypothetical protein